jgi:hypothetical protein
MNPEARLNKDLIPEMKIIPLIRQEQLPKAVAMDNNKCFCLQI